MIFHSINKQINVTSGASLGAAVLVMILVGVVLSNSLFSTTSTSLRNYSQDIISESLRTIKSDIQEVEAIISDTVRLAKDTATTQEYLIRSGLMSSVTREQISEYAKYTLASNERILGTYITWEKNAVDAADTSLSTRVGTQIKMDNLARIGRGRQAAHSMSARWVLRQHTMATYPIAGE